MLYTGRRVQRMDDKVARSSPTFSATPCSPIFLTAPKILSATPKSRKLGVALRNSSSTRAYKQAVIATPN